MAEDVNLYNEVLDNYTFDVSIGDLAFNEYSWRNSENTVRISNNIFTDLDINEDLFY